MNMIIFWPVMPYSLIDMYEPAASVIIYKFSLKRRHVFFRQHGLTSRYTVIVGVTAVRSSSAKYL